MQGRLELPAPAAPEPLDRETEPALELVEALEGLELVPVEGDEQGAGGARLQRASRCGGQVPEKVGVGRGAGEVQAEEGVLAEGCLGDRGEHPGGVVRGARARLRPVEDEDAAAPLGQSPGDPEADDTAPDHNGLHRSHPFAGIVPIRSTGRGRTHLSASPPEAPLKGPGKKGSSPSALRSIGRRDPARAKGRAAS